MQTFKINLFLLAILFASIGNLNAQTEQGKLLIGGQTGFSFSSSNLEVKADGNSFDLSKTTSLEFSPQIGYFVIDNLSLGIRLPIQYSRSKAERQDLEIKNLSLSVGPFVRYYFNTATNLKPYFNGEVSFGSSKAEETTGNSTSESSSSLLSYGLGAGLGVFLNDQISFDVGLGYSSVTSKTTEENPDNVRLVASGVGIALGFTFVL